MEEGSSSPSKKVLPIFLLGCGGVGQQLISHILNTRALHAAQEVHVAIQAICDSSSLVMGGGGVGTEISDAALRTINATKASKVPLARLPKSEGYRIRALEDTTTIIEHLESWSSHTSLILVDCTANEETAFVLSRAAEMGQCIVLANKKPLTTTLDVYGTLAKNRRRLRYESTVGAGLPVITTVTRFLMAGDPVFRIVGALSGTLGYVMSGLQEGRPFSQVVQLAKSLGYTEPDPRDDLSGMDVARKALILARLLGWSLNMKDVQVESLFPPHMDQERMPMEQFLNEGLSSLDEVISNRLLSAKARGNVLRYVATIAEGRCKVGIAEVLRDSPLGQLKGSDNLIEVYSRCYKESPFVICGAGAGNDTTAAGVLADILDLQDLF